VSTSKQRRVRPARHVAIEFIAEQDCTAGDLRWGVEPMYTVLCEHGIAISAWTYFEWVTKSPT
jgi:hypothetical protein